MVHVLTAADPLSGIAKASPDYFGRSAVLCRVHECLSLSSLSEADLFESSATFFQSVVIISTFSAVSLAKTVELARLGLLDIIALM